MWGAALLAAYILARVYGHEHSVDLPIALFGVWFKIDSAIGSWQNVLSAASIRLEHIRRKLVYDTTQSIAEISALPEGKEKQMKITKKIGDFQTLLEQVDEYVQGGVVRW